MAEDSELYRRIRRKRLFIVADVEGEPVYFGEHLVRDGYEEENIEKRRALVRKGVDRFNKPRPWDTDRHKVRSLNEGGKRIFVIYETSDKGSTYYFMEWDDMPWVEEEWQ